MSAISEFAGNITTAKLFKPFEDSRLSTTSSAAAPAFPLTPLGCQTDTCADDWDRLSFQIKPVIPQAELATALAQHSVAQVETTIAMRLWNPRILPGQSSRNGRLNKSMSVSPKRCIPYSNCHWHGDFFLHPWIQSTTILKQSHFLVQRSLGASPHLRPCPKKFIKVDHPNHTAIRLPSGSGFHPEAVQKLDPNPLVLRHSDQLWSCLPLKSPFWGIPSKQTQMKGSCWVVSLQSTAYLPRNCCWSLYHSSQCGFTPWLKTSLGIINPWVEMNVFETAQFNNQNLDPLR